jgi:hypothetical protein
MARELGLNPAKFGGIDNHKQQPWKAPLPEFIEHLYEKAFGKTRPDVVRTIEERSKAEAAKKAERKAERRARKVEGTPVEAAPKPTAGAAALSDRIDRRKLRDALRTIGDESVFYMLHEALELLSPDQLVQLVGQYIQLERIRSDAGVDPTKRQLLADVKAFNEASRAGAYYESFNVNSSNFMDTSTGTRAFISECRRQIERCIAEATVGDPAETREAFEIIFALIRHIDECHDDIVFFADEGGSWQLCIDWSKITPAWFACLSRCAEPEDFVQSVVANVATFDDAPAGTYFAAAKKFATPSQAQALDAQVATSRKRPK